ncbi:MAG TPA: hypothetical protein VHF88_07975 [Thermoleophilaceae bacterium]|nr:hypothetical protein [Thermoleophilaceae bacterium]
MTFSFTITRARLPLLGLIAAVLALATTGIVLSVVSIAGGSSSGHAHQGPVPNGPQTAGEGIPTSFGAVAVEYAVRLSGLTSKDLAGMTHGVQDYVPPESSQVQVAVTLANMLDTTNEYAPEQFRLIAGTSDVPGPSAKRIVPTGATFKPGTLQPDAAIEGSLSFVVPNKRAHLWVEFHDPERAEPLLVDLGKPAATLPGAPGRADRKRPELPAPPTSFDGTTPHAHPGQ